MRILQSSSVQGSLLWLLADQPEVRLPSVVYPVPNKRKSAPLIPAQEMRAALKELHVTKPCRKQHLPWELPPLFPWHKDFPGLGWQMGQGLLCLAGQGWSTELWVSELASVHTMGWKRPLKLSNSTVNPALPRSPPNPVPKCHIYGGFELFQGW